MINWKKYSDAKPKYPCSILATNKRSYFDHYSAIGHGEFWSQNSFNLNKDIFDSSYSHWSYFDYEECKKTWNKFDKEMPDFNEKILAFGDEEQAVELVTFNPDTRFFVPGFQCYIKMDRFLKFYQHWTYYRKPND